jgi:energy-coupling factor transporter ATP-binding protein EcfA2
VSLSQLFQAGEECPGSPGSIMSEFTLDLNQIDLGAPAAERDIRRGLEHYFVESEAFRRVSNGSKTIVIGNRGSGKSAIFQMMAARASKQKSAVVIELAPEDYSYELLKQSMLAEGEGSWMKHGAYAVAWKYLILVSVMKALAKDADRMPRNSAIGQISRYVRDQHYVADQSKLSALISYLKRLEGVKIGKYEAGLKTRELEKLYRLEEIAGLLPALEKVLKSRRVMVFVDELDRGWDASEDAQGFVAGLFQACLSVNEISDNLTVYMSLRQELYENIPALYEDAQKYRDLIETVTWSEEGLRRLLCERLRYSIASNIRWQREIDAMRLPDVEVWGLLFEETLSYRRSKSFNYIVDRTLYRPREIIQFCGQVVDEARDRSAPLPLDYASITSAERVYSEDRGKDIAAEFRFQYPGLLRIFEAFRGLPFTLEREHLEELCIEVLVQPWVTEQEYPWLQNQEPDALIEALWKVGFLRAQAVGGIKGQTRSGSSYLGVHQAASLNIPSIGRFQVHPMFRSWLSMRAPKGTKPAA